MSLLPGVVFDLDGVIVMSEHLWERAWVEYSEKYESPWSELDTQACQGKSVTEWATYLGERTSSDPADVKSAVVGSVLAAYVRGEVELIDGSLDMVADISAMVTVGLASSAPRAVIDQVMGTMGLWRYFQATVSSAEVARGKPSPDVYIEAVLRLGIEPHISYGVEDSSNGVRAASSAGLTVIAIEHEQFPISDDARILADCVYRNIPDVHTRLVSLLNEQRLNSRPGLE